MCFGVPGTVMRMYEDKGAKFADISHLGQMRRACMDTIPDLELGDLVLVHAGYVASRLTPEQASQTIESMIEAGLIELDSEGMLIA